jgi:colicin import membrane protein
MNAQQNYEQLKRRNRRRLVGALIMVLVAIILLVVMINHRDSKQVAAPQLDVVTNVPSQLNATENDSASATSHTAVPIAETVLHESVDNMAASAPTNTPFQASLPASASTDASVTILETKPHQSQQVNQPTVNVTTENNQNTVSKSSSTSTATETTNSDIESHKRSAGNESVKAPAKTNQHHKGLENKAKTAVVGKTESGSKKTVTKENASGGHKTPSLNKLTPQQILENKAAKLSMVSPITNQTPSTAVANSRSLERTIIQVGAYTTEAQARLVQHKLAAIGIASNISSGQTSKGTLFRVRTGIYNSRAQALQNLNKIQAAGMNGMVIGL